MEATEQSPVTENSAPAPEAAEPEIELSEGLLEEQQPEDDEIEDELDGVKVRGKKDAVEALKAQRLKDADYTQKTQALAEQRKMAEAQRLQFEQTAQIRQALVDDVAEIKAIDRSLAAFNQVNWDALIEADPKQAQKLDQQMRALQQQRNEKLGSLQAKEQQAFQQQQAGLATLKEQAEAYLAREVKGWSPERSTALAEYAVKAGFPPAAIPNITAHMPAFGVVLHKAELYDKLVAKATSKPKGDVQEQPVPRLSASKATAVRDPDKLSTSDWLKWREAQLRRR